MRIRSIRPEFWHGEKVLKLTPWARLLLLGLNNYCDDHGRGEWNLISIRAHIFPDKPIKSVEKWIGELVKLGCIQKYTVDGKTYLDIPNWHDLQRPNRAQPSKLPSFTDGTVIEHGTNTDQSRLYSTVQYSNSTVRESTVAFPLLNFGGDKGNPGVVMLTQQE